MQHRVHRACSFSVGPDMRSVEINIFSCRLWFLFERFSSSSSRRGRRRHAVSHGASWLVSEVLPRRLASARHVRAGESMRCRMRGSCCRPWPPAAHSRRRRAGTRCCGATRSGAATAARWVGPPQSSSSHAQAPPSRLPGPLQTRPAALWSETCSCATGQHSHILSPWPAQTATLPLNPPCSSASQ